MATENQNFIKWDEDSFVIQFNIIDAEIAFDDAHYNIWWGIAASDGAGGYTGNIIKTKTSGAYNPDTNGENNSARWINGSTLQISMSRADSDLAVQDYYHELVISPGDDYIPSATDSGSIVAATGLWTLKLPLFPPASRSLET